MGTIILGVNRIGSRYIINTIDYINRWEETTPIKDCSAATTTEFLFENVVTRFGCPKILISDQDMYFVNQMIEELTGEF